MPPRPLLRPPQVHASLPSLWRVRVMLCATRSAILGCAALGSALLLALLLDGCQQKNSEQINYQMGERITAGPMIYNVVQTVWRTQLGSLFKIRVPERRFLFIMLSATNSGGRSLSVPFFALEGPNGEQFKELENGDGVDNWFGLLRDIGPAQTKQGNIVFDAPLTSFRLRLTDGGEPGSEKFVWVEIPLRLDTDSTVSSPLPGPADTK